ncbi:MAG: polysaccharide deacetylase family protein [Bacteroidales bacterium]|nr:polysaccharide deacetylase family protein [Bacteroidales bacterium]
MFSEISYILPFYHTVSNNKLAHVKHLFPIKTEQEFINDLEFFCSKYVPVSLSDFYKYAHENFRNLKKPVFHLSFDDGLYECYDVIMPILQQKGIPATFFVNSDFIDNKNLSFRFKASLLIETYLNENISFDRDKILQIKYDNQAYLDKLANDINLDFNQYLKQEKPYLSFEQLKKISQNGFSIGAHSTNHPEFRFIDYNEQFRQIKMSVDYVSNNFTETIKAFSFPFTDFGLKKSFFEDIYNSKLVDITFGTAGIKNDRAKMNFQRIPMETGQKGNQTYYFQQLKRNLRILLGKNYIKR